MSYCMLSVKVGEVRAYHSGSTLWWNSTMLGATLEIRGTAVVLPPHPLGSGTGAWGLYSSAPRQCPLYVQCRGHGVQSSNAPSGGVGMLGGCGLHSWDARARAAGGLLGTPGLYSHRAPSPLHRAERVTCNSVQVQSLVNVNSSSLKSLVKESQKCVACM